MADFPMNGRGFAPQAGSYQAYHAYQPQAQPETPPSQPVRAVAALSGAALSLALLVGVGVWGYKLMARDVAGVPVVRAVQGEMRVRPENPGGEQALNQGLAVNEVAAAGGTAGPSERIVLAPEPIDLNASDTPLIDQLAAAQPRFAATEESTALTPSVDAQQVQAETQAAEVTPQMASIQALAAQIAAGATPLSEQGAVQTPPVETSLQGIVQTAPAQQRSAPLPAPSVGAIAQDAPGVAISMRPKIRPEGVRMASLDASAVSGASTQSAVRDIDPASIAAGTRLVQLGAYESPEIARQEWQRFSGRFADYMAGKDRVIQRATSGGRTFYRLRAMGFSDLSDARRFCAALTAQNTDCIPVVTR